MSNSVPMKVHMWKPILLVNQLNGEMTSTNYIVKTDLLLKVRMDLRYGTSTAYPIVLTDLLLKVRMDTRNGTSTGNAIV